MSLTRAAAESILVKRLGKLLTEAGLDGTTVDGSNADLNDPIGWALRQAGYTVADVTAVADSDLVSLATADTDKLLDLAELRALENISGNWAGVDIRVGERQESYNQFRIAIEERIARKEKQILRDYGIGASSLETGLLTFDFAAKGDDEVIDEDEDEA